MKPLLILLSLTSLAFARIGETPAECEARYGKPTQVNKELQTLWFEKNGFRIVVEFHEEKACLLMIAKGKQDEFERFEKMSDAEKQTLLDSNAGNGTWEKKAQFMEANPEWSNLKAELFARYQDLENVFFITTKGHMERENAAKEAKEKKALEGF